MSAFAAVKRFIRSFSLFKKMYSLPKQQQYTFLSALPHGAHLNFTCASQMLPIPSNMKVNCQYGVWRPHKAECRNGEFILSSSGITKCYYCTHPRKVSSLSNHFSVDMSEAELSSLSRLLLSDWRAGCCSLL